MVRMCRQMADGPPSAFFLLPLLTLLSFGFDPPVEKERERKCVCVLTLVGFLLTPLSRLKVGELTLLYCFPPDV